MHKSVLRKKPGKRSMCFVHTDCSEKDFRDLNTPLGHLEMPKKGVLQFDLVNVEVRLSELRKHSQF